MDGPDYRTAAEYFRDKAHAEKTERMGGMSTHAGARPPTPVGWSDTDWLRHLEVMPPIGYAVRDSLYGTSKSGVLRFCGSNEVGAFAVYIAPTQAAWQPMKTAPMDGTAVLVLLDGSDIPNGARWLRGKDDPHATETTEGQGWHLTWDGWPVPKHDGPRYWMYCPDDPDSASGSK